MKKFLLITVLFTLFTPLCADDFWFVIRPGKMVSGGAFMAITSGSPTTMVALGFYKDPQGNDTLEGNFVNDGYNFSPIPRELAGSDIMTEGFVTNAIFMDRENIGAMRNKFEGSGFNMTLVSAFVTANIFTMGTFNITHVFADPEPQVSDESLLFHNGLLYLGTHDGQLLISDDSGVSWQPHRVAANTDVTISSVFAVTDTHLVAAGGVKTEDAVDEKITVEPRGGVWESIDGGKNWTPLKNDMEIVPVKVIKTASDRIYLQYMTEQDLNSTQNPQPTRLGMTDDNFISFSEEFTPTANTGKTVSGMISIDYKNGTTWIAGMASDFTAATMRSEDEGATWIEYFLPPLGEGMLPTPSIIHILDDSHIYAGFSNTAILKFGDINEDYSAIPDDKNETNDSDALPFSDFDSNEVEDNETNDETLDIEVENPDTTNETVADEGCSTTLI